jgi:regulator of nucleoside diphosphate kinase
MGTIMQFAHPQIFLPLNEYRRLQRLMHTMIGGKTAFASVLRRKLGSARSVLPSAAARDVAMSGVRVRFRIDRRGSQDRILTWRPPQRDDRAHLSLLSPRGLALLGLSPGESIFYRTAEDRTELLEVEEVRTVDGRETSTDIPRLRDIPGAASLHSHASNDAPTGGQHA